MSSDGVRRFEKPQIIYHWVQALPYLVLFVTGALILLQRLFELELVEPETLVLVHEIAGVVLAVLAGQMALLMLLTGSWRLLVRDLSEAVRVTAADIRWMALVPLNAFFPRKVKLPPVGRFNVGQKMHLVFIFLAVPGFVATGILMLLLPGALGFWILHVALFLGAAGFLAVHVFLALFNPSTRKALGGMLHGQVTVEYVREHHPLSLEQHPLSGAAGLPGHGALVSWRAVGLAAAGVALAAALALVAYGPRRFGVRLVLLAQDLGADAILPRDLCASHQEALERWDCLSCHELFHVPPSSSCLSCHEGIAERLARRLGVHGRFDGECRSCHEEHQGAEADLRGLDPTAFNHEQARFRLTGLHRESECSSCHVADGAGPVASRTRYTGLSFDSCERCHDDPHGGQMRWRCDTCHTERGWKNEGLVFSHERHARFLLVGRHAQLACSACHAAGPEGTVRYAGLEFTQCDHCHEDPHAGSMSWSCRECHRETGWRGDALAFSHDRHATFRLLGRHAALECGMCHRPVGPQSSATRYTGIDSSRCDSCHQDPHGGQMRSGCDTCHVESGWKGEHLAFDHSRHSVFSLDAIHAGVDCAGCHGDARERRYRPLDSTCSGCHKAVERHLEGVAGSLDGPPDPHSGRVDCTGCHPPERAPLAATEYGALCRGCHNRHYEGAFYEWRRTLGLREARARERLEALRAAGDSRAASLQRSIDEARSVGFHHLQLARRLWDGWFEAGAEEDAPEE
jgi:formate dehydrogenase gamma subunit